jgi:hypothetical protein
MRSLVHARDNTATTESWTTIGFLDVDIDALAPLPRMRILENIKAVCRQNHIRFAIIRAKCADGELRVLGVPGELMDWVPPRLDAPLATSDRLPSELLAVAVIAPAPTAGKRRLVSRSQISGADSDADEPIQKTRSIRRAVVLDEDEPAASEPLPPASSERSGLYPEDSYPIGPNDGDAGTRGFRDRMLAESLPLHEGTVTLVYKTRHSPARVAKYTVPVKKPGSAHWREIHAYSRIDSTPLDGDERRRFPRFYGAAGYYADVAVAETPYTGTALGDDMATETQLSYGGLSLYDVIHTGIRFAETEQLRVAQQVLQAVAVLRKCGIFYTDMKLEHILCTGSATGLQVQVIDFDSVLFDTEKTYYLRLRSNEDIVVAIEALVCATHSARGVHIGPFTFMQTLRRGGARFSDPLYAEVFDAIHTHMGLTFGQHMADVWLNPDAERHDPPGFERMFLLANRVADIVLRCVYPVVFYGDYLNKYVPQDRHRDQYQLMQLSTCLVGPTVIMQIIKGWKTLVAEPTTLQTLQRDVTAAKFQILVASGRGFDGLVKRGSVPYQALTIVPNVTSLAATAGSGSIFREVAARTAIVKTLDAPPRHSHHGCPGGRGCCRSDEGLYCCVPPKYIINISESVPGGSGARLYTESFLRGEVGTFRRLVDVVRELRDPQRIAPLFWRALAFAHVMYDAGVVHGRFTLDAIGVSATGSDFMLGDLSDATTRDTAVVYPGENTHAYAHAHKLDAWRLFYSFLHAHDEGVRSFVGVSRIHALYNSTETPPLLLAAISNRVNEIAGPWSWLLITNAPALGGSAIQQRQLVFIAAELVLMFFHPAEYRKLMGGDGAVAAFETYTAFMNEIKRW